MLGFTRYVGDLAKRLPALPIGPLTPIYHHISIKDVIVENCQQLIDAAGIPESPLNGMSINGLSAKCKDLIRIQDVDGLVIVNSSIQAESAKVSVTDGRNIMLINVKLDVPGQALQAEYLGELSRPIMYNR